MAQISIRNLLIGLYLIIGVLAIIIGTGALYYQYEKTLTQEIENNFQSIATLKAEQLKDFLGYQKSAVNVMAQSAVFRDLIALDRNDSAYAERFAKVQKRLTDTQMANPVFYENSLLNKNGVIIASTNSAKIGQDKSSDEYFLEGRKGVHIKDIYFSPDDKLTISFSAPLLDENKNLLGVYVSKMELSELVKILQKNSENLGKTGELVLIDGESGVLLAPTRYLGIKEVLVKKINTTNALSCMDDIKDYNNNNNNYTHITPIIGVFNDYRGIKVLGTHEPLVPEIDWCLTAKIDEKEALGISRRNAIKNSIFVGLGLFIAVFTAIYFISKLISTPIKKLKSDVDSITKGNLEIELKKSRISEIQSLTDSLNRILASLKLAILRVGISKGEIGLGEAIQAKEEAEEKYKLLYDTSVDAIMTLEPLTWRFTAGNPSALRMFNCKDEKEFTSLGPWELSPKYQPDGQLSSVKAKKMIEKAMKEGSNYFEWMHKRYKGEDFLATVLLSKIKENGDSYLQATVRDISKEKEAEANYHSLFENAVDAIFIAEPETRKLVNCNKAAVKLMGYSKEEILKMRADELHPKDKVKETIEGFKKQTEGKITYFRTEVLTKSGKRIPVSINASPVKIKDKNYIQGIFRDISREEEATRELKGREAAKNIATGRAQIVSEREKLAGGREEVVGKREKTATGRERIVGRREKIKTGEGREGIALGREEVAGKRERTATEREKVVGRREELAKRRERKR